MAHPITATHTIIENNAIQSAPTADRQLIVGAAADQFARAGVFSDYQARRALSHAGIMTDARRAELINHLLQIE